MNSLLNVLDVSFSRGSLLLFENISFSIGTGDRLGFVGHNGSGKSSLLSLLAGKEEPDTGEIRMPRGQRVALVEQFVPGELAQMTLIDAVLDVIPAEQRPVTRHQADELLDQLGFAHDQTLLPLGSTSGGQQNLALLARAIILQPELLLMDEPGNHMDVMALAYLQRYLLSNQSIPFLMISHDRELLNACCNRTIFLRDKTLFSFDQSFDQAAKALAERDVQAAQARQAEEKEIRRLQTSAKRLAQWGKNYDNEDLARKAKTMQKRVERLKEEQTAISHGSGLELHLNTESLRARSVVTLENLVIVTPDGERTLLEIEFQHIRPGDRIALLGRNGVGKSTTINRLVAAIGQQDDFVRFNPNVNLGYYDQELEEFSSARGRFDWLRDRSDMTDEPIKQVLLKNGIPFTDFDHSVDKLSGGERARLMFMLFQLNKPNFLILDEPTNHIDIQGREQLEQQLIESDATLLITSHDRRFIEQVANRWWWINNEQLIELNGLDEFYAAVQQDASKEQSQTKPTQQTQTTAMPQTMSEDDKLARIDELEKLLREDKARKTKFQKLQRQQAWEKELAELWKDME
ncbi:MAG: ATP-binding cassette domain-containing protein [Granulosicoccus sp.]|nr:ATP-binding cassette domain-containing protein [Granulosicoccus sp.]